MEKSSSTKPACGVDTITRIADGIFSNTVKDIEGLQGGDRLKFLRLLQAKDPSLVTAIQEVFHESVIAESLKDPYVGLITSPSDQEYVCTRVLGLLADRFRDELVQG